ncbi:hypothetical protein [Micromonospora sp. WMMD1082]|uniref:hypothetical protein n=1 Tax=Micromonospora sp. WMMD1082 TaxID=3016104 RepID=UPI002416AD74|nr:hypothetical protein [Micromonospora sp. WMMD1082]MDG4796857.1 hypothetical protein [Micromonospora sp. WMMD1082]
MAALAVLLAAGLAAPNLLVVPAGAAVATASHHAPARSDFTVTPLPDGGWRVELRLAEPLPVRAVLPDLAVDGRIIGPARSSPDGLVLSAETTDPAVVGAERVEIAWNGLVPGPDATRAPAPPPASDVEGNRPRRLVHPDPAAAGRYRVERLDYDLGDTAARLSGLGDHPVEMRAAVYAPAGAKGARPVVVFLHGRHEACYDPQSRNREDTDWPCPTGLLPIDSYLGYTYAAEALTTHGYVVVSISANGINVADDDTDDDGALARAQLVMKHLDLLAGWNDATDGKDGRQHRRLAGRLDLRNVGLMGHSRGGEGVVKAALLNADRTHPYGVRAVLPLAPVDFARLTIPDAPMAVLLPYCDGDVADQQGQHFFDDTRHATRDDVLRSALMVMGANHNFFNTEWTPGVAVAPASDDWRVEDDEVCGTVSPTRLTGAEQRAVGRAYLAGFFRLVQGRETAFLPLFDGTNGTVASVGRAEVYAQAQQPGSRRLDVATLQRPAANVSVVGFDLGAYCHSVVSKVRPGGMPCSEASEWAKVPHWTPARYATLVPTGPMLRLRWSGSSTSPQVNVALDRRQRDVRRYEALTVRVARDEAAVGDVDLKVTVTDGRGRAATVRVGAVSPALHPFPASTNTTYGMDRLGKTWLRTVRIPIGQLRQVDLGDVRLVTVVPATPTGGAYLSDITFDRTGVGQGGPTSLPQVSIRDNTVREGDGPGIATMRLTLSRPPTRAATVQVQTAVSGSPVAGQVLRTSFPVTIPAGATTVTIAVPLHGNTDENTPALRYKISISAPTGAVIGNSFAWLTVRDDDAT